MKAYIDQAAEIIGDRTSEEIAHDDAVVEALHQGRTIEEALAIAGEKHPEEKIDWDDGNVGDIGAHFEYLKEHSRIMKKFRKENDIKSPMRNSEKTRRAH
ncbi:hypothetical protein [Propionivibrio sp.]|uniref:hypothetical protein n=1 Tax=Propionivibrio sp. TaxID=2212460 RepID=UPI003BF162F2